MVKLEPVDAVEVTLVVDNFVDIFFGGRRRGAAVPAGL